MKAKIVTLGIVGLMMLAGLGTLNAEATQKHADRHLQCHVRDQQTISLKLPLPSTALGLMQVCLILL